MLLNTLNIFDVDSIEAQDRVLASGKRYKEICIVCNDGKNELTFEILCYMTEKASEEIKKGNGNGKDKH